MEITVTDAAKDKFLSILENEDKAGQGLRVTAKRGMSPFSVDYGLSFVDPDCGAEDDEVVELDGFNVYVDAGSQTLLDGAIVDYVHGLNESGFKITNPKQSGPRIPEGPLADRIQQILNSRINPGIASHGGVVSLAALKDDVAYLRFGGGCQGCGMVDVTLKQGVEVALKEAIPELKGVRDITDHAAGENPYYQGAR
jgi:Fe/S biogenesis protein NfuA